jgi:hypothetical protein
MKKASKSFKVGDRVGATSDPDSGGGFTSKIEYAGNSDLCFGKIVEVLSNDDVKVLWDNEYHNDPTYHPKTRELLRYDPAMVKANVLLGETEVKKKYSELEKEYQVAATQVKLKLKEAGKLLREANKIAKKSGRELAEMYDAIDPLYSAMDACGWRTSSFSC